VCSGEGSNSLVDGAFDRHEIDSPSRKIFGPAFCEQSS
jgi:hypothetical protein